MFSGTGLRYVSLCGTGGYADAARRYLIGLERRGVPLTWRPMVPGNAWRLGYEPYRSRDLRGSTLGDLCNRPIEYDTVLLHTVPEYYPFFRAEEPGKRLVGVSTWETDRPPRHWPRLLNLLDLVLVPCQWNRDVFRAHGVTTPIEVVPYIAHPGPFPEKASRRESVFYAIGSWTARKAMWNVVEAFARAFRRGDRVRLVLKTSSEDLTRGRFGRRLAGARVAAWRILRRHPNHPPVDVVTRTLSQSEIDALHSTSDCLVSLGHGEGWSLPAFDAAAFGNPVVATRFGGPLEYLEESPYLVDCRLAPVSDPVSGSYSADQRWAVPDIDAAAEQMREIYERPDAARVEAGRLAHGIRSRFREDEVVRTLLGAL